MRPSTSGYSNSMPTSVENLADEPPARHSFAGLSSELPRSPAKVTKKTSGLLNPYGVPVAMALQGSLRTGSVSNLSDRIRVCVRKRPLNKKEVKANEADIANVNGRRTIRINEPK